MLVMPPSKNMVEFTPFMLKMADPAKSSGVVIIEMIWVSPFLISLTLMVREVSYLVTLNSAFATETSKQSFPKNSTERLYCPSAKLLNVTLVSPLYR